MTDEEWSEACRASRADLDVLNGAIQGQLGRGTIGRLIALRVKLRYGHAVPKGEAIKPETQKPTVYVLEVPAGQSPRVIEARPAPDNADTPSVTVEDKGD